MRRFWEKLRVSAEGGANMLYQITKPTLWRGCASLCRTPREYAELEAGVNVKFDEWHVHEHG